MKRRFIATAAAVALVFAAGAASAHEVFSVWGHGSTQWEARDNAWANGQSMCLAAGYAQSSFEEVQSYESGLWTTYGLITCY